MTKEATDEGRSKTKDTRKPWVPPAMTSGPLFESNSLSCGKNSGVQDQCIVNPGAS